MKLFLNRNNTVRVMDIHIMVESAEDNRLVASYIHPPSIRAEYKLSEIQLGAYEDFIDTVISIINHYGFEINKSYQSKKSYAYYVEFKVFDIEESNWLVRFRISAHNSSTFKDIQNVNYRTIFRKIMIGTDKEFTSYSQAIKGIDYICKGLAIGDLEVINTSYEDMTFEEA